MNQPEPGDWQELGRVWTAGRAPVGSDDIVRLHEHQCRRLQTARVAEVSCTILGVAAALWLALASRFLWLGIATATFSVASLFFALRSQRQPAPRGCLDLLRSLQESLAYQDWLAEQLRHGRVLGFVALFAVVMAASTQLMHLAGATRSGLLASAAAALAISGTLAWNMTLAWQVWRRTARLRAFMKEMLSEKGK